MAVSNATMEKALRVISVERGYDPRDFSLICYGGAGGLHAADLARAIGLPAVIVPRNPGAFSALGILLSDAVRDVAQSVLLPVPAGANSLVRPLLRQIDRRFHRLELEAYSELRNEGFDADKARASPGLDLRYQGQSYELPVPYTPGFRESYHRQHTKAYGYAYARAALGNRQPAPAPGDSHAQVPLANAQARPRAPSTGSSDQDEARMVRIEAVPHGGLRSPAACCRRRLRGPAVIVEYSATTVVPPDFICKVDEHLNLVIFADAHRRR